MLAPRHCADGDPVAVRSHDRVLGKPVLDADAVLIRAGRITRARTGIPARPGIEVADGRGCMLLPGLIDAHAHPAAGDLVRALVFGMTTGLDLFSAPGVVRRAQEGGDQPAPERRTPDASARPTHSA